LSACSRSSCSKCNCARPHSANAKPASSLSFSHNGIARRYWVAACAQFYCPRYASARLFSVSATFR
jgi:hypothetical protein